MLDRSLPKVMLNAQCEGTQKCPCLPLPLARGPAPPNHPQLIRLKKPAREKGVRGFHGSLLSAFLLAEDALQVIPQSHEKENIINNISLSTYYIPVII